MITEYAVGKVIQEYDNYLGLELLYYDHSSGFMMVSFNNPTVYETSEIAGGNIDFRSIMVNGLTVLCVKFGNLNWMDTVCDYNPDNGYLFEPIPDGLGKLIQIVFVDSSTGVVQHIRAISFGTEFSRILDKQVLEQVESGLFGEAMLENAIKIHSRFSTRDLTKMARNYYKLRAT